MPEMLCNQFWQFEDISQGKTVSYLGISSSMVKTKDLETLEKSLSATEWLWSFGLLVARLWKHPVVEVAAGKISESRISHCILCSQYHLTRPEPKWKAIQWSDQSKFDILLEYCGWCILWSLSSRAHTWDQALLISITQCQTTSLHLLKE